MKLIAALQLAGVLHLGLIAAGATMPRVVNLRHHIGSLPPFIHRLFWVYYSFIALFLFGFGSMTFFFAAELASGTSLARAVCAFLAAFWLLRLCVATFVFDVSPYLTTKFRKLGYHATNAVFTALPLIYAWSAFKGVAP